jgi:hypothetical protein
MTTSCETIRPLKEEIPQPPAAEVAAGTAAREAVLLEVRNDCRVEPGRYLDEIVVPFGGE